MDIVIYGAGKIGRKARSTIEKYYPDVQLKGYLDTFKKGDCEGVPILGFHDIDKDTLIAIAVLDPYVAAEIYDRLASAGFRNISWYLGMDGVPESRSSFPADECLEIQNWGDSTLPHIEFHICDKCNLNCKGCTHFSPLYHERGAGPQERLEDVRRLKTKAADIIRLDILGGEPLLDPDLPHYLVELRKLLPHSFLQIFTNGLLLPSLPDEVMGCIQDNDIKVSISEYRPTHHMIDKIVKRLDEYHIRYMIFPYDSKQVFNKPISLSEHSKYPQQCISDGCVTLADGKIARCPTLMYVSKFNEKFGTSLPTEGIMSLDDCPSGRELLEKLKEEVPLCRHCVKCDMEWSVCGKEASMDDFASLD